VLSRPPSTWSHFSLSQVTFLYRSNLQV